MLVEGFYMRMLSLCLFVVVVGCSGGGPANDVAGGNDVVVSDVVDIREDGVADVLPDVRRDASLDTTEDQDLGNPDDVNVPDTHVAECATGPVCETDDDCPEGQGMRCNTVLNPPKCQVLYCGEVASACSENLLCASKVCFDDKCCEPDCEGRECGDNGCGGVCGGCLDGDAICKDGNCCLPNCTGMECGNDPVCGESCGKCEEPFTCQEGDCVCTPDCDGKECGTDPICGYSCGVCDDGWGCNSSQICECTPQCDNVKCGSGFPDSCGGECGCGAASNGVEKACQGGMCECDKFKSVKSADTPEEDKNGNKIYLSCIENKITCIYADGSLVDFNNPTILGQYILFITFLQDPTVTCENNSTQWPDWYSYHIVNDNTTCEVAINEF